MPSTAGKKPGLYSMEEAEQGRRSGTDPDPDWDEAVYAKVEHVKVYCLTNDGQMYDQGTSHVTIDYFERSSKIALAVVDEADDGTLLFHNISSDGIYRNEEDSATAGTGAQKQSIPARPKSGGHADCDDDNDDKNYESPPRKPIKADEALVKPVVRSSPDDGSHTSVKAHKKPKLRVRFSFAKSDASASVTARHSGLEDEEEVARSPSTSTESSEDSDGLGDGSPGSQHQLQQGEDGNAAAEDSSPKMVLDSANSTDSEPK